MPSCVEHEKSFITSGPGLISRINNFMYEGRAKSSLTNRLPLFYPRYILKCFTALKWCVDLNGVLTIPVYFVHIAFQLTQLFQIEIDAVIYTDQFTVAALGLI